VRSSLRAKRSNPVLHRKNGLLPLPEKVMLPAEIIDKTNYKTWLIPVEQRSCPEWSEVAK